MLWKKREALFAPGDFKNEENFVKLMRSNFLPIEEYINHQQMELDPGSKEAETLSDLKKSLLITEALAVASAEMASDSDLKPIINKLEGMFGKDPLDFRVANVLGRLLKKIGDLEKSIIISTTFLEKNESLDMEKGKDYFNILYNRACYLSLLYSKNKANEMKDRAIADLQKLLITKKEKSNLRHDVDFESIRDDQRFQKLLA